MLPTPPDIASSPTPRWLTAAGALAALAIGSAVHAADYSLGTSLKMDTEHDSNIRLLEDDGPSAFGYTVSPRVVLGVDTEQLESSLDARLNFLRFNRSELDTDDQDLLWNLRWRGERSDTALVARWVRDSTLTSEQLDSGRVGDASRRESYLVQPSWTYYLTERNLITLSGGYNESKYKDDTFVDYDYSQASLLWTHIWDERWQLLLQAQYSDYRSGDRQFGAFQQSYSQQTEDVRLQIGGQYQWSENLSATMLVGRSRSKLRYDLNDPRQLCSSFLAPFIPQCQLDDADNDLSTLDASLTWNNERNQLTANASRATQPSSDGQVLEVTQLRSNWTYKLWEHGQLLAGITLGRHRAPDAVRTSAALSSERDFGYASVGYKHLLNERWAVDTTYQYRYQDYELTPGSAESHVISLGISYQPPERHWSR